MNNSGILLTLFLFATGCNKETIQAQADDENVCELHHQPLKSVFGYAAGSALMVSPGYGVTEFNVQFGDRYPHFQRVALSSSQGDGWTEEMTVKVCEECEKDYRRDFATYLKTDEKERSDQYMEFLMENRPASRSGTVPDSLINDEGQGVDPSIDISDMTILPPIPN